MMIDLCYREQPCGAIAKVGRKKWFWVCRPTFDASYRQVDPAAHGVADSIEEAIEKCGIESRGWGAKYALEWRSIFAARRRRVNPNAQPELQAITYAYHLHQTSDGDSWTCAHRIIKKTHKRIFIEADCYERGYQPGGVTRVPQLALDRARLEAGEAVYVCSGRFRGAGCGEFFTLSEPEAREHDVPDCLVAPGLKSAATKAQLKRAFRHLSKKHHPDAGGDAEAFRNLQEQYEAALAIAAS